MRGNPSLGGVGRIGVVMAVRRGANGRSAGAAGGLLACMAGTMAAASHSSARAKAKLGPGKWSYPLDFFGVR
jgi:hypothetical protein